MVINSVIAQSKECPKEKLPAAIRMVTKLPFKPKLAHVNFYKRLIVDTLGVKIEKVSVEYPQMYLADQSAAAVAGRLPYMTFA